MSWVIGSVFGVRLVVGAALGGWWLYQGSTSGEFKCMVNFIPCPVLGFGLMLVPVGRVVAVIGIGVQCLIRWRRQRT